MQTQAASHISAAAAARRRGRRAIDHGPQPERGQLTGHQAAALHRLLLTVRGAATPWVDEEKRAAEGVVMVAAVTVVPTKDDALQEAH